AGRQLSLDGRVYASEMEANQRNKALARLLESYERIITDPLDTVDIYTRQCSLSVTAHDLAVMGATLADGGINPVTRRRVVSAEIARDTLALLASCGMYENSGEWLFEIDLPAKSGVSGGIVAIAPGKGALGTFSPRLDSADNSVRGQRACFHISRVRRMNRFATTAEAGLCRPQRARPARLLPRLPRPGHEPVRRNRRGRQIGDGRTNHFEPPRRIARRRPHTKGDR